MSNIGLNANIYHVTGKYLNLLNDFIVQLKSHPNSIDQIKKNELVSFFSKIKNTETLEPQFQLLTSIIERELREKGKPPITFISNIIKEVEKNDAENFLPKLEFIVDVLDSEHFEALAKIKGE